MDEKYYNGEVSEAECKRHYTELKKYAEDKGICISQAHAPCPSSVDNDKETERLFQNIVSFACNCMDTGESGKEILYTICKHLGCFVRSLR